MQNQDISELLNQIKPANIVRTETENNKTYKEIIERGIQNINKRIEEAKQKGLTHTSFVSFDYTYEKEFQKIYESKGYTFRPTGIVGGVYQDCKEICW
jgi:hypothetical protein